MRFKGILITLVILLSLVFAAVNWQTITTPLPVNLLFTTVQLPLGLALLITVVSLSALFFLLGYIDRARQVRQAAHLEHQLNEAHAKLETRRTAELDVIDRNLTDRVVALDAKLDGVTRRMVDAQRESLGTLEKHIFQRLEALENSVLLVRNELAADIAVAEEGGRQAAGERQG